VAIDIPEEGIMKTGLIHICIGDGKGKTTAAVGLAVRAAGCGKRVVFGQMLKGTKTGETTSLEKLGVTVIRSEKKMCFTWEMDEAEREACKAEQVRLFKEIMDAAHGEAGVDLLVIDEALVAMDIGMLDERSLRELLEQKPDELEIMLTGRRAPDWLLVKADYVTEMKKIKHPYDRGVTAREGVEY